MPIVYEAPQPSLPSVSYGYGAAAQATQDAPLIQRQREAALQHRYDVQQFNAQAAGGFGGGGGRGGFADPGAQDAINNRDANATRSQQFAAQENDDGARFTAAAQQQHNEQISRFRLQAELQETELSQQEKVRLQRMKNALGDVASDASLSDSEKADLVVQLKTGINPLENRIARQKLANETMLKESMVEQRRAQAALDEEALQYHSKSFEEHHQFVPDKRALADISADLRAKLPQNVLLTPDVIEKMARQIALRQGLGQTFYQESPRKWVQVKPDGGPGGAGAKAGAADEPVHPTGLDSEGYLKQRNLIAQSIHKEAAAKNAFGTAPADPEIQTEEGRNKRLADRLRDAGLPPTLTEFNQQQVRPAGKSYKPVDLSTPQPAPAQQPPSGATGIRSLFSPPASDAAQTPQPQPQRPPVDLSKEKPFKVTDPDSQTPRQKELMAGVDDIGYKLSTAVKTGAITEAEEGSARALVSEARRLLANHGAYENIQDPALKRHFETLMSHLNALIKKAPPAPAETPSKAASQLQGFLDRLPGGSSNPLGHLSGRPGN